jgi:hypothetical protein
MKYYEENFPSLVLHPYIGNKIIDYDLSNRKKKHMIYLFVSSPMSPRNRSWLRPLGEVFQKAREPLF